MIHEGKQPQVLEESVTSATNPGDDFTQGYRNTFTATPWDVIFRPPTQHKKNPINGSQTAVVTGPETEEIHCDEHGRVKVQFHWDRQGQANDKTSCWLRVASNWAGDRYGGIPIPRVGMEVLVTFLEGDPDQPLITGCLYHKTHQVPYSLPEHKTRSVFKTLSSPGGDGFNELRIEDKAGEEQIFIHAQRDWDQNIQHDQHIRVGNERHDRVEAHSYTELLAEEHHTTHADRKTEIKSDDHLTVANNQHIKLGTAHLLAAGREIHLKAGQKMVIEAGMEMTLKAGGSFIKIDPSGVTLVGPQVRMNSGGSPGNGPSISIQLPVLSSAVAYDTPSNLLNQMPPSAENDPKWLQVQRGQLTFDVEGNDDDNSIYFSRVAHWPPIGASGITIGRGYDIGHQPNVKNDLASVGIAEPLLTWLEGGKGLTRNEARDYLSNASPEVRNQQITRKQQHDLFLFVYERMEDDVKRICNKRDVVEAYGSTDWDSLNPKIKEMLVDLRYRGDYTPGIRRHIQEHVANNDFEKFREVVTDRSIWPANLPDDRFSKRSLFLGK